MTKLNLACGPHPLDGFVNLGEGWRFQDGLPYPPDSIAAITESHGLMYLPAGDWTALFTEIARVLEPGGIVRVTEDDTENPASERYGDGAWPDAVTLTGPKLVRKHMRAAGLTVSKHTATSTGFRDDSLLQAWHGPAPKCFWLEGRKP